MSLLDDLASLRREAESQRALIKDKQSLETVRREWLAKEGKIRQLFKALQGVPAEQKPEVAQCLNDLKSFVEAFVQEREKALAGQARSEELKREFFDLTLPAKGPGFGGPHPITRCEEALVRVVKQLGFKCVLGPEVETDFYCFDALNVPLHHPARDLQDTFYTDLDRDQSSENGESAIQFPLRTHVTAVSARAAERESPPIKVVSLGRVYRNEAEDASHTAMFHQFDLVWIDKGLTLAHLMGLITHILKEIYGRRRKVRFVPKFYPYTEPSIGPQVDCVVCRGSGCPSCGNSGWVTVAGAGLLHRNVLSLFKHDPDKVAGLAFGMGTSRLTGQMFQFRDVRTPYENDLRILKDIR